jgi:predicted ATPase
VTYGSLLQDRRRALHTSIVDAIERLNAERLGEHVEALAHHALRGEAWDKAARYLREAGTKAFLRSATADAVGHLTKGLEALERLPESPGRDREELASLLTLGPVLHALKGLGAPEAERVFARARNLSERTGETVPAFQALWGQWMVSAGLRRIAPARRIGSELLSLAERADDRSLLLQAHHAMWATSFWLGEFGAAEHHIACGVSLYDRDQHRSLAFLYGGHDAGVCCRQFSVWTQWTLGRPTKAAAERQAAIALAEQLTHPPSLAQAFTWSCALSYFERDAPAAGRMARQLIDLSTERDLPPWRVAGSIFEGWSRAEAGDKTVGIKQIQEGLAAAKTTGTLMPIEPLYLMVHADACLKYSLTEEGLSAVDDALAMMEAGGQRTWQSNLCRLRGELLLLQGRASHEEAERSFRNALEIARQQRAQAWELRAATSLGQLLGCRGGGMRRGRPSPTSSAASRRGSRRPTSRRPRHCSPSSPESSQPRNQPGPERCWADAAIQRWKALLDMEDRRLERCDREQSERHCQHHTCLCAENGIAQQRAHHCALFDAGQAWHQKRIANHLNVDHRAAG